MAETGQDLARLEGRLGAVRAVGGVVHAIWALSRAQLAQVEAFSLEASAYLDWVDEVLERVAGEPYASQGEPPLLIVLGPERAFCAGMPAEILRSLPPELDLGIVGARLAEFAAVRPALAPRIRFRVSGPSSVDDLEDATERLAREVLVHGHDRPVLLAYPQVGRRGLKQVTLLAAERGPRAMADYESYSSRERLLEAAVLESAAGRLRVGLAEALRSEVRARAAAAEGAKQAVDRQEAGLVSALRVRQQEQITGELCELYAGHLTRRFK